MGKGRVMDWEENCRVALDTGNHWKQRETIGWGVEMRVVKVYTQAVEGFRVNE